MVLDTKEEGDEEKEEGEVNEDEEQVREEEDEEEGEMETTGNDEVNLEGLNCIIGIGGIRTKKLNLVIRRKAKKVGGNFENCL
jgi:hypothetical protein